MTKFTVSRHETSDVKIVVAKDPDLKDKMLEATEYIAQNFRELATVKHNINDLKKPEEWVIWLSSSDGELSLQQVSMVVKRSCAIVDIACTVKIAKG